MDYPEASDLGQLVDLLAGAGYKHATKNEISTLRLTKAYVIDPFDEPKMVDDAPVGWYLTVQGGAEFFTVFVFDTDGSLITHGCWE
jgi:hypothetical protein